METRIDAREQKRHWRPGRFFHPEFRRQAPPPLPFGRLRRGTASVRTLWTPAPWDRVPAHLLASAAVRGRAAGGGEARAVRSRSSVPAGRGLASRGRRRRLLLPSLAAMRCPEASTAVSSGPGTLLTSEIIQAGPEGRKLMSLHLVDNFFAHYDEFLSPSK